MKYLFVSMLGLIFISSCSESKKETPKSDYELKQDDKKDLDSLNQYEALRLSQKYSAINNWEEKASFTYKLQERLEDTIISFTGFISDITIN